jgi:hypothetical protein
MRDGRVMDAGEARRVQTPVQTSSGQSVVLSGGADVFITSVDPLSARGTRGRAKSHDSKGSARLRWRWTTADDKGVDPGWTPSASRRQLFAGFEPRPAAEVWRDRTGDLFERSSSLPPGRPVSIPSTCGASKQGSHTRLESGAAPARSGRTIRLHRGVLRPSAFTSSREGSRLLTAFTRCRRRGCQFFEGLRQAVRPVSSR